MESHRGAQIYNSAVIFHHNRATPIKFLNRSQESRWRQESLYLSLKTKLLQNIYEKLRYYCSDIQSQGWKALRRSQLT